MLRNLKESALRFISPHSTEKVPLCAVCQAKIQERFDLTENPGPNQEFGIFLDHHRTLTGFKASVNQECHVCVGLWQNIPLPERTTLSKTLFQKCATKLVFVNYDLILPSMKFRPDTINMTLSLLDRDGDETDVSARYSLEVPLEPRQSGNYSPIAESTKSTESMSLARKWYSDCTINHTKCNEVQSRKGWFPSRLIDVGLSMDCEPRLLITRDTPPNGAYVTLSHRWGSARFIKLTYKSLDRMKQKIPMTELPKTFIDAIYVARYLGLRYIWIDSLCIIQDSASDWLGEALLMNLVYSNSACNIAATGASDSSEGLFRQRTVHNLYPCEIAISRDGIQDPLKYHIINTSWWDSQVSNTPLNQRAWVVQERFLAPRVLHFGYQQLLWECHELNAAEKYPNGLPTALKEVSDFKSFEPAMSLEAMRDFSGRDWNSSYKFNMLWNRVIKQYSSSQLTKPEDKVVALSGIAKMLSSVFNDEYIVGLWREYLPSQLSWEVENCRQSNGEPSFRPSSYLAPTWSWLSVNGVISATGWIETGSLIDVVDISVIPQTSDTTGPIKNGSILVKGIVKQLRLDRVSKGWNPWETQVNGISLVESVNEMIAGTEIPVKIRPQVILDVDKTKFTNLLYIMCLADHKQHLEIAFARNSGIGKRIFMGMILEPTGKRVGEFRRLGIIRATAPRLIYQFLAWNEKYETIPCESYDDLSGKYTIRIV